MNADAKAILEAALLCAPQPLALRDMLGLLGPEASREGLAALLAEMQAEWQSRGSLQLVEVASGWRFQTHGAVRVALQPLHPEKPRRHSRAALETLAVIAYRQPVTRGDIEDIRGVVVSSDIVKQLEERGWIESIGQRDAPGRPHLYATTKTFLDDLGLASLAELPALDDLGLAPLIEPAGPRQASLLDALEAVIEPVPASAAALPDAPSPTRPEPAPLADAAPATVTDEAP